MSKVFIRDNFTHKIKDTINFNQIIMGGALLTRKEEQLKKQLLKKLENSIAKVEQKRDQKILDVHNETIKGVQKLQIEYKYSQATKNMIHDGDKSQAMSMIGALKYIGVLT